MISRISCVPIALAANFFSSTMFILRLSVSTMKLPNPYSFIADSPTSLFIPPGSHQVNRDTYHEKPLHRLP